MTFSHSVCGRRQSKVCAIVKRVLYFFICLVVPFVIAVIYIYIYICTNVN